MKMTHPDFPNRMPVETSKAAFTHVWSKKGWVLAGELSGNIPVEKEPETPFLEKLSDSEILSTAKDLGIEDEELTVSEVRELIENAPAFYDVDDTIFEEE